MIKSIISPFTVCKIVGSEVRVSHCDRKFWICPPQNEMIRLLRLGNISVLKYVGKLVTCRFIDELDVCSDFEIGGMFGGEGKIPSPVAGKKFSV